MDGPALALAILLLTAACTTVPKAPPAPELLTIHALGSADPGITVPKETVASSDLTARATVNHDTAIADVGQRVLAARAQARRGALRELAQQLQARPEAANADAATLTELLERETEATFEERGGMSRATVVLPASRLADRLRPDRESTADSEAVVPDDGPSESDAAAYNAALRDAREQLREVIPLVPVEPDGPTIGEVMRLRPSLVNDLNVLLLGLQPETVDYPAPGQCRMTLTFDMAQARELARQSLKGQD